MMERAPRRTLAPFRWQQLAWTIAGLVLPLVAVAAAAFLIFRTVQDDGQASFQPAVIVDAGYRQRLDDNIRFFESRVTETNDHLSYNRLTQLYLQRLRETGDVSDVTRAEIAATRSLEASPANYDGLLGLAMVRLAQHDFPAAASVAVEALGRKPGVPDALALLGDAQFALGDYESASESYRRYLEAAPGFSAFARQAAIAELFGNVPLAEQFWTAAIDADASIGPENAAWARVQYANLLFLNGEFARSEAQYEAAIATYPGYPAALAGLGRAAAAQGDDERAIAHYQAAVAVQPVPGYVIALGEVLARAGRADEAARQFALVGAIDQLYAANGVRNEFSLILFDLDYGNDPAALDRARVAYEERPSTAAADVYAWALHLGGRSGEAERFAQEALRYGTRDPLALFHAGLIARANGETTLARARLQEALHLNPEFSVLYASTARAALADLEPSP